MRGTVTLALGVLVLSTAACEATLGAPGGSGNNPGGADAPGSPGGGDAMGPSDGPGPDAPACFNGRRVYLNFDGQALSDAAVSDATLNRASWMNRATGAAPPYKQGDPNRAALIQQIVTGVTQQLAGFPITVVTTRPATGPYVMIVYGGTAQDVGSNYGVGVMELDCGDTTTKSDVGWITDTISVQRAINTTIGAIGFGLGLTATTDPLDCMCGWANNCQSNNNVACTLTPGIARDPNASQLCPGVTTQDEVATFAKAFCE